MGAAMLPKPSARLRGRIPRAGPRGGLLACTATMFRMPIEPGLELALLELRHAATLYALVDQNQIGRAHV